MVADAGVQPLDMGDGPNTQSLYLRLGGEAGITEIVSGFARATHANPIAAPFFENANIDGQRLAECLVRQLSALTGGVTDTGRPIRYPGADGRCRDMRTIHAGMGITFEIFDVTAVNLVAELVAKGVGEADLVLLGQALRSLQDEIVSEVDPEGVIIPYHRIGGYSAIARVVDDFVGRVISDDKVNGFFDLEALGTQGVLRLKVCLTRQICMVSGGPCLYGQEIDGLRWHPPSTTDAGVSDGGDAGIVVTAISLDTPCKDMASSHRDLNDQQGAPIDGNHFVAFVNHLILALETAGVEGQDIGVIVQGLRPTCHDIAANTAGCPGLAPVVDEADASPAMP